MSSSRSSGPSYSGKLIFSCSSTISHHRLASCKFTAITENSRHRNRDLNLHRLADFTHCLSGHALCFLRAFVQNLDDLVLPRLQLLPPLVNRRQSFLEVLEEPHLA